LLTVARKIIKTTTEETEAGDPTGTEPLTTVNSAEEADVIAALVELEGADDVKWRVTRIAPKEKAGWLDDYVSSELSLAAIREKWGGGKVRVVGFKKGRYFASVTLDIQDQPVKAQPVAPAIDPVEMANAAEDRMIRMITALGTALKPAAAPAAPTITELVAALVGIKQLAPESPKTSELDSVLKGMELAHKLQSKDGETNWLDIVRQGLPMIQPVLDKVASNIPQPGARPRPPQLPQIDPLSLPGAAQTVTATGPDAGNASQQSPAAETGESDVLLILMPWMRQQLDLLIFQAKRDKDPELYAELLVDNIPDGVPLTKLREWLGRDDWWQILQQFHAGVAPYQGWFTSLRDIALATLDEMIGEETRIDETEVPGAIPAEPTHVA
jgi:hypothetical protein